MLTYLDQVLSGWFNGLQMEKEKEMDDSLLREPQ